MIEIFAGFCVGSLITFILCFLAVKHMTDIHEQDFYFAVNDIKAAINDINLAIDKSIAKVAALSKTQSSTPQATHLP